MILIGSKAANFWHPKIWSSWNDEDYIATYDQFKNWYDQQQDVVVCYPIDDGKKFLVKKESGFIIEIEIAFPETTAWEFLDKVTGVEQKSLFTNVFYPDMNWLFALKASHRYLKDSPHFEKTMRDYHQMKKLGCAIPDQEWFEKREKETYKKQRPKLNVSKNNFFIKNQGVQYIYDHDTIHQAMSLDDEPAYKKYQPDDSEVMVSKKLWDQCDQRIKINGVLEETYVLALERSVIPYRNKVDPYESFKMALSKVCTSITSGWFREFAYEHYYDVLNLYDPQYVNKFDKAVSSGIVKKCYEEYI